MLQIFIKNCYRKIIFPIKKVKLYLTKKVVFDSKSYSDRQTTFDGYNYLGMEVFLSETHMGYGSYVADFSKIFKTYIGKYCSIGQNVGTAVGRHPINENISTSPSFFSLNPKNGLSYVSSQKYKENATEGIYSIFIGNDVWIGSNSTLVDGITIGDGAIIGAGAVVTKNVEPYSVYAGNPARKLKDRFSKEEIDELMKIKWWEIEHIERYAEKFSEPTIFLTGEFDE